MRFLLSRPQVCTYQKLKQKIWNSGMEWGEEEEERPAEQKRISEGIY